MSPSAEPLGPFRTELDQGQPLPPEYRGGGALSWSGVSPSSIPLGEGIRAFPGSGNI